MSGPCTRGGSYWPAVRCGLLLWGALIGCANGSGPKSHDGQAARARGAVVATVNGSPIGAEDVRELAQAQSLTAREALQRLEEARLVEQHAQQRGYGTRTDVARETKRALVQALLAETVEREVRPELIPLEQVKARFETLRAANNIPAEQSAQYERSIREQLSTEQRKAALEALLSKLRANQPVQLDEAELQKRLADPAIWGGGT
jgi:hypothetical protein